MTKDYSNKNLQKASFKNEDLTDANFSNSDLRGADFSGANLTGADFTGVKTGIIPLNTTLIFIAALIVSLISGYFAMLAGNTVHKMFDSKDPNVRNAGIATVVIVILFVFYAWWKGTGRAIERVIIPVVLVAIVIGIFNYISRLGTGIGILDQLIVLLFVVIMLIVGTVARATANTLSVILFIIVALSGGMFGKSVGGGVGTVILALASAQISKRAFSGAKGFKSLRKVGVYITRRFGTSFRNSTLAKTNFSASKIHNADFTDADISSLNWGDSKKMNCINNEGRFTSK